MLQGARKLMELMELMELSAVSENTVVDQFFIDMAHDHQLHCTKVHVAGSTRRG